MTGTIADNFTSLIDALKGIPEEVDQIVAYNQDELLQLRKDAILLGRNSDGQPFTPGYLNDPYFNDPNREIKLSAVAYANYKHRIDTLHRARIEHLLPYPNKDADTPNLRLTTDSWNPGGNFQDSMFISVTGNSFEIGSTYHDATAISLKYKNKVYPLGWGEKMVFWNDILCPGLASYFERVLQ